MHGDALAGRSAPPPQRIFISYQRESAPVARRLRLALEVEGFEAWLDTEQIRHSQRWPWMIDRALRNADRLVLLLTDPACASVEVFNEWFFFYQHRKPLHVVRLDFCELHYQLLPFQRLEWGPQSAEVWEDRVAVLVQELRAPFVWPSTEDQDGSPKLVGRARKGACDPQGRFIWRHEGNNVSDLSRPARDAVVSNTRLNRPPNVDLARLIEASGASHNALAHRVNQLAHGAGMVTDYSHTSVANWCRRGMVPRWPVPMLLAQAIGERLGRPVQLSEIGMGEAGTCDADAGLDFPRAPVDAVRVATAFWSSVNHRGFLSGSSFAVSAFTTPVTRWLVQPTDEIAEHSGRRKVGLADLEELREAAHDARTWDSKYGGGNWKANSVTACLRHRAAPLLASAATDELVRELFSVTAELSRLAGWTAFDVGQHQVAQRHFIQALRLARVGRDVQLGCYVLTTMAIQSMMRGFANEAVDMAQGAFERAKYQAAPRVLAFTKVIEAKAHARSGDARQAAAALAAAEGLLDVARPAAEEPSWIDFFDHARLATDATEVFLELKHPKAVFAWNTQALAMPQEVFTRCVGIRLAIVGTAHLQAGDLERGLDLGSRSVDILAHVDSDRALDYIRKLTAALAPWWREPVVREYIQQTRRTLGAAA
jgi:hypothetical protein